MATSRLSSQSDRYQRESDRSCSSSSSSSFVSWCESEHGSLPSVHQRRLRDAEANRHITNTRTSATFIPIQLQHPAATTTGNVFSSLVNSAYKTESKCLSENHNQGQSQDTRPTTKNILEVRSEACRSADDTSNNKDGSEDGASSSYDDLAEDDDNNDGSFESSILTPPQVVEFRGSAALNEDTLSSLVDLSLSFTFDEDEEGNTPSRSSTSEHDANIVQVEGNPTSLVAMDNEDAVLQLKSPDNNDNRSKVDLNATANQVNAAVAEVSMPTPSTKSSQKAKGVSFENNAQSRFRQASKIPRWKKKARYVSSSCSTKAVKMLPSFMSPTRASMAKNRGPKKERNVSGSKSTGNARKGRAAFSALQTRGGTNNTSRNQRDNLGVSARGKENENVSNMVDAVKRVKLRTRER